MLDNGATTIWERWDGLNEEHGFQSPKMNSFNHYSLGSVGEWLYRFVLGIDQAPGTVGFARLLLRPHPGTPLNWARGSYHSVRGKIAAAWERSGDQLEYRVSVPPNTTATVLVPGAEEPEYHVGPGTHSFTGQFTGETQDA
jgi:alpha-L-rhamnosidase